MLTQHNVMAETVFPVELSVFMCPMTLTKTLLFKNYFVSMVIEVDTCYKTWDSWSIGR